ncbi:MAG: P1 family peptidase [Chloroflexi bacterium]|nr:P1 family peptidase [Chloroflexota bacterium]
MVTLKDAITDVPGIRVGHWTYRRGATGCTAVLSPAGAVGGVDVRGAAPGTRETDLLRPGNLVDQVHGVLLSGGSAFGLAAADGVMRYLAEHGHGLAFGGNVIPIVPGAILFDLGLGTKRAPDAEAGYRAARRATRGRVEEGTVGAGTGATVAKMAGPDRLLKGGLGTASEYLDVGVVVGAIAAVNSVGAIRDPRTGEVVAAPRADDPGGFVDVDAHFRTGRAWPELVEDEDAEGGDEPPGPETPTNTTLAVVATDAKLTREQANRLATVCHDGFARTIWPAHGRGDGDTIFTLATGEVEVDAYAYSALEAMATRAVERAVLRGVRRATGLAGVPSAGEWREQRSS